MFSKQSVLPNFIRATALVAIASFSLNASAGHHEKDVKKAKSEHMQKAKDSMHGDEMKDKLSDEYQDMKSQIDDAATDLQDGEDAVEAAADGDQPE